MPVKAAGIYRYPVKGLSPEPLERVTLASGECLPHDRRFALARAATRFDPARPAWLPKANFFMLMRDAVLAQLRTRFDEQSGFFTVERGGRTLLRARITDDAGRAAIDAFFADFLKDAPGGPPRTVEAPSHTFSDARQKPGSTTYKYVSLVNLASVGELEKVVRTAVDPLRFRANFYLSGLSAWNELDWVGSEVMAGNARLRVVSPITRCAATSVNPVTATRDLNVPAVLREKFGRDTMGVYAEVVGGGEVAVGDLLVPR
ncbi:MAG: MOSC domain-containing protein [Burkholderiales bacterium]